TGWRAGLAYRTFPTFDGGVLPTALEDKEQVLHVAHRLVAYLVLALVVALWLRARQAEPMVSRFATIALVLTLVQVALGALNIWFELAAWSVAPHLAVGSWIVGALLVVVFRVASRPSVEPEGGMSWSPVPA
ncbi:MAG TPA: COX15/CtaA family protein, partial [Frankiaceae bacterium]|nr:COX15/CtaA family protein [Frankiaceae bacterium]